MSAWVFLVRGRGVDLVAMTALHALRETMGLADEVQALHRDDLVSIEGAVSGTAEEWADSLTARQHWFNPNKHRYALYEAAMGAHAAAEGSTAWPEPWLRRRVASDRPELAARPPAVDALAEWLELSGPQGLYAVPLLVYDRETGVRPLAGRSPQPGVTHLRGVLWTLVLAGDDAGAVSRRAEDIALTRHRRQGLLVNPHMEGWAWVGAPRPLGPITEVEA